MAVAVLNVVIDSSGAASGAQQVSNALDTINQSAVKAVAEVDSFSTKLGSVSGAQVLAGFTAVGSAVDNISTRLSNAVFSAGAFFTALLGGSVLTAAINAYKEFDQALIGVGKTTNITGAELAAFGDKLKEMTKELPFTAAELAKITQVAGQLGVEGEANLLKFTEVIAKLGTASDLAGEEGATMLATIINVTSATVEEVDKVASTLVALGNTTAATESQIANMAVRLGQSTSAFQLATPEVLGLAASMVELGIRAELGGNQIGVLFTTMSTAIAEAGPELQAFAEISGLSIKQFTDVFNNNPVDALIAFAGGLKAIMAEDPNALALALESVGLNTISMNTVLPPLVQNLDKVTTNLGLANDEWKTANALTQEFAIFMEGAESQYQLFLNAINIGLITIGGALVPALKSLQEQIIAGLDSGAFESFANAVGAAAKLVADNITLIVDAFGLWVGMKVGGFLLGLTGDFIKLGQAVTGLASSLIGAGSVTAALGLVGEAIEKAGKNGSSAALALDGLIGIFGNLAKFLGPVGIAITAAVAALAALAFATTDLEEATADWEAANDALLKGMDELSPATEDGAEALLKLAQAAVEAAEAQVDAAENQSIWGDMAQGAQALWDVLTSYSLLDFWSELIDQITSLASAIAGFFDFQIDWIEFFGINPAVVATVTSWFDSIGDFFSDPFGNVDNAEANLLAAKAAEIEAASAQAALAMFDLEAQVGNTATAEEKAATAVDTANQALTKQQEEADKATEAWQKFLTTQQELADTAVADFQFADELAELTEVYGENSVAVEAAIAMRELEQKALQQGITLTAAQRTELEQLTLTTVEYTKRLEARKEFEEFLNGLAEERQSLQGQIEMFDLGLTDEDVERVKELDAALKAFALFEFSADTPEEIDAVADSIQAMREQLEQEINTNNLLKFESELASFNASLKQEVADLQFELGLELQFAGMPEAERTAWISALTLARDLGIDINDISQETLDTRIAERLVLEQQKAELLEQLKILDAFEDAGREVGSAITDAFIGIFTGGEGIFDNLLQSLEDLALDIGQTLGDLAVDILIREPLEDYFGNLFRQWGASLLGLDLPGIADAWDVRTDGPLPVFVTNELASGPGIGEGGGPSLTDFFPVGSDANGWAQFFAYIGLGAGGSALIDSGTDIVGAVDVPDQVVNPGNPTGPTVPVAPINLDTAWQDTLTTFGPWLDDAALLASGTRLVGFIDDFNPDELTTLQDMLNGGSTNGQIRRFIADTAGVDVSEIPVIGTLLDNLGSVIDNIPILRNFTNLDWSNIPLINGELPDLSSIIPGFDSLGDFDFSSIPGFDTISGALPYLPVLLSAISGDPGALGSSLANLGLDFAVPGLGTVINLLSTITGFDLSDIPVIGDLLEGAGEFILDLPIIGDAIGWLGDILAGITGSNNRGANLVVGTGFTDGIERDTVPVDTPFGSVSIRDDGSLRASDQFQGSVLEFMQTIDTRFAGRLTDEQIANVAREVEGTTLSQIRFPDDEPPILGEDLFGIGFERANQILLAAFPELGRVRLDAESDNPEMQRLLELIPIDTVRNIDSISPILAQLITGEGEFAEALGINSSVGTDRNDREGRNVQTLMERVDLALAVLEQNGVRPEWGLDADDFEQALIDADIMRRGECVRICDPLPLPVTIVGGMGGGSLTGGTGGGSLTGGTGGGTFGGSVRGLTATTYTFEDQTQAINNFYATGDRNWYELAREIGRQMLNTNVWGGFAANESLSDDFWQAYGGVTVLHEGGVVGEASGAMRHGVPVSIFENAPRFHTGLASLAHDEFPAILQRGEAVIPLQDNARMAVVSDGVGAYAPLPNGARIPVEMIGAEVLHGGCGGGGCGCGGACGGSSRYVPASLFDDAPRYHDGLAPASATPVVALPSPDGPIARGHADLPASRVPARDTGVPMKLVVPTGKHRQATLDFRVSDRAQQREFVKRLRKAGAYI